MSGFSPGRLRRAAICAVAGALTACSAFEATSPFEGEGNAAPSLPDDSFCSIPQEFIVSGGVGRDGIPALVNPSLVSSEHAEATYVREVDRVIGIEADGRALMDLHLVVVVDLTRLAGRIPAV